MTVEAFLRAAMEFCLGVLHLAPAAFWAMTLQEYDAALAGHNRFHGGDDGAAGPGEVDVPRARRFIADAKRQFPDTDKA
jgi:hypothetical protein